MNFSLFRVSGKFKFPKPKAVSGLRGTPRLVGLGSRVEGWSGEMRNFLNFPPNLISLNQGEKMFFFKIHPFRSVLRALALE